MDRSGRRTAVIAGAIALGAVFGGAPAAPASADDRGAVSDAPGASDAVDNAKHRQRTPARAEPGTTAMPPGTRGPGPPDPPPPPPPDPCPWLWIPPPKAPSARNAQGGIIIGTPIIAAVTPVPIFGDRRVVGIGPADGDISLTLPPLPAPESPVDRGPTSGSMPTAPGRLPSALVAPSPVVPPAVPVVAAPPGGLPARSVPNLPAPGSVGPVPAEAAAVPSAPKLPEPPVHLPDLRPDDLGRLAAGALPGLAALAGMTLLGGAIGYRQARAGYLLRAAGAGRFLQ